MDEDRGPATSDLARATADALKKGAGRKLAAAKAVATDELLDLDLGDLSLEIDKSMTPEAIAARDKQRAEKAKEIQAFIEAVPSWMDGMIKQLQNLHEKQGPEKALAEKEMEKIVAEIATKCAMRHPLAKRAAIIANAAARVKYCPLIKVIVQKLGHDLASVGFLSAEVSITNGEEDRLVPVDPNTKGAIRMWQDYYILHPEMDGDQAAEVVTALEDLIQRTLKAGRAHFSELVSEIKSEATPRFTCADFYPGRKVGRISMFAPDQEAVVRGEKRVYRGGHLLVESDGRRFWIRRAIGGCQNVVGRLAAADRSLALESLESEELVLAKRVEKELFSELRTLHSLVRRAWVYETQAAVKAAQLTADRVTMAAEATVPAEDFFLGSREGRVLVDYDAADGGGKSWRLDRRGETSYHKGVVFLAERRQIGDATCVAVVQAASHLANDFFTSTNREFQAEGEKFEGLQQPLKGLLRWAFGETVKVSKAQRARTAREAEVGSGPTQHGWDEAAVAALLEPLEK